MTLYLPGDTWSPRYDDTFYTVKVEGFDKLTVRPSDLPHDLHGKTYHPAYYYNVAVFQEHNMFTVQRRYSHFQWLLHELVCHPPDEVDGSEEPPQMPSGTCPFRFQSDGFAQNRVNQLGEFLDDLLSRPGYSSHPAVKIFLELNSHDADNNGTGVDQS